MSDIEFDASAYERPLRALNGPAKPLYVDFGPVQNELPRFMDIDGERHELSAAITLRLPMPPSVNATYRAGQGKFFKSKEAAAWQRKAVTIARESIPSSCVMGGTVALTVWFFFRNHVSDVSNRIKALEDALNGIAWVDDMQVTDLRLRKRRTDGEEFCVVEVNQDHTVPEALRSRIADAAYDKHTKPKPHKFKTLKLKPAVYR